MVKHNGRLSMKQFMPMKPVKRGIKVWECAEASSGFVCDFQVCTGKRQDGVTEKNLGYLVVHDLTQNFIGKNHHIFCDNFFTSVSLPEDLLNDNNYLCGTTRAIRKDFPKELANNLQVKRFKQRESLFRRREDLVATVWKDKRFINFLSTESNPTGEETVNRKQQDEQSSRCQVFQWWWSYNQNMGGVDLHNQLRGYYAVRTKSRKW